MSQIFNTVDAQPTAAQVVNNLISNANITYMRLSQSVEQDFQQFWYLNRDENGNRTLEGPAPTGIQLLQALGTQAAPLMAIAWARVQFVAATAAAVGASFDVTSVLPPYDLTWNEDGSLASYTLRT